MKLFSKLVLLLGAGIVYGLPVIAFSTLHAQESAPEVVVYRAALEEWHDSIEALGTLRASETVVLTASVSDTITSIKFDDGQRVKKGEVLAQMTDGEESALVDEMIARVAEAKRQFDRVKTLPKSGAVSESLLDQREREFKAATAQLDGMKSRLKDRIIDAPFDGVVGLRNISVGALVEPGDEITTLTDDSVMKLDFSVPSVYLSSLEKGLTVSALSAAYPDKSFTGKITGIDSKIDPVTRSIVVRAEIPNEAGLLKPGLLMTVEVRYRPRNALVIPEEALLPSETKNFVLEVDESSKQVTKTEVQIGTRALGQVEVVSGISAGALVITHGTMTARPGQAVTIAAVQKMGEGIQDILRRKASS